jgi:alpha-L-fucosidase 2
VQKRFPPMPVRADGIIADWQREAEPECYLWVNVLFGLYPGRCLLDGKLIPSEAVRRTLEVRDIATNTFSNTWSAGAWARLKDGERAYACLRTHLARAMVDSLLGVNKNGGGDIFQTDANLGLISAFAEMVLQSDENSVTLLPALPSAWKNGEIRDFRTRCGVRVAMRFKDGVVWELTLTGDRDTRIAVRALGETVCVAIAKNETKTVIKEGRYLG